MFSSAGAHHDPFGLIFLDSFAGIVCRFVLAPLGFRICFLEIDLVESGSASEEGTDTIDDEVSNEGGFEEGRIFRWAWACEDVFPGKLETGKGPIPPPLRLSIKPRDDTEVVKEA